MSQLRKNVSVFTVSFLVVWLCDFRIGLSQESPDKATAVAANDEVAATVDGFNIRLARVDYYLSQTVPQWPAPESMLERLRAEALEHLVRRQLIASELAKSKYAASLPEIEWRLDQLRNELSKVDRTLADHLKTTEQTDAELKNEIAWEISWRKYLAAMLTEEYLARYFDLHHRDFDGTELHVAQLLLASGDSSGEAEKALDLANRVRGQLLGGEVSWNDAVELHSIGPSKTLKGDLGWIMRDGPMPEDFTRRAFELNEGEIAEPFLSKFGVHLVKCLEVRPGKRQLGDVRADVERAAMTDFFNSAAEKARASADIRYANPR